MCWNITIMYDKGIWQWYNISIQFLFSRNRVTQIKTYSWDNAQVILVGNKCDMEDERVISFERGKQLADQLGVEFFETSAKENVNVKVSWSRNCLCLWISGNNVLTFFSQNVFERLVDIICDKMSESLDSDPTLVAGGPKGQRLTDQPQGPPNANCNC